MRKYWGFTLAMNYNVRGSSSQLRKQGQDQSSMGLVGVLFGKYIGLFSFGTRFEVEDTRKRTLFEGGHCNNLIRTKTEVERK